MAGTLINSANETNGDGSRFLRARQSEILQTWAEKAAAMPPHSQIGPSEMLDDIEKLLGQFLSAVFDRSESGSYATDGEALEPLAGRSAAAGVSIGGLERSLTLLQQILDQYIDDLFQDHAQVLHRVKAMVTAEFNQARSEIIQLYYDATLGKLHQTEDKYLSLMRNATEALFVCSAEDGSIIEANRKAEELSGHQAGTMMGMPFNELENEHRNGNLLAACKKAYNEQESVVVENANIRRKDGTLVYADIRISPFEGNDSEPAVLVTMRDTTCEHELEERMHNFSEQLNRTANEKAEEIAVLTRLTSAISTGADIAKIFQVVVFEIGKLISFDRLSIMLVEDDGTSYRVMASAGKSGEHLSRGTVLPTSGSLMEFAASERKPVLTDDLNIESRFEEDRRLLQEGILSYVCSPLMTGDKLVGAMLLASSRPKAFGLRDVTIMQDISEQVAVAMRWAKLQEQESRRKAEMQIINEVGREAMSTLNLKALLKAACSSIQKNFTFYDVSVLLVDWSNQEIELAARAGHEFEDPGDKQAFTIGDGPIGRAIKSGKIIRINNVAQEAEKGADLPWKLREGSKLCVPIKIAGRVDGVLYIQCKEINAFQETSVNALETLADLVARAIENARLYQRTSSLRELNENIIATMPSALLVLDQDLRVVLANSAYCKLSNTQQKDAEGKTLEELWDEGFLEDTGLADALTETLKTGKSCDLKNIRSFWAGRHVVFNFGTSCINTAEQPRVLLIMEDVTETVERAFRLSMLREINEAIQSTLELDKILRLVLTCVTAGHALGFNRGFLLMVNRNKNVIEGTTGIGPTGGEDAMNIYSDEALKTKSLKQLLQECDFSVPKEKLPLYKLARKMVFSLNENDEIIVKTVKEKKTYLVQDAEHDERVSERFHKMLGSNSFISVPLVAKDEVIGVIVADNLYSGHPITHERAELLALFANHAGLAIENGESYARLQEEINERIEAYQRLEEMKEREVRTCQLAAIGEMAARVAHEIRNPLVNIGLLARQIVKSIKKDDNSHQKAEVIVDEVMRLEKILTDVVDFSKPAAPHKMPMCLDTVVDQVTEFVKPQLTDRNILLKRQTDAALPQISADPSQIKQALLNIVKNAIEAIDQNGTLTISTRSDGEAAVVDVIDTGPGIIDYVLENMYNLFYTTKQSGSGLGLAITRKIVEDHRGYLDVQSSPGEGTTFSLHLPIGTENADAPLGQTPTFGGPSV